MARPIRAKAKKLWLPHDCMECNAVFYSYPSSNKKLCSNSCRAKYTSRVFNMKRYLPHPKKEQHYNWRGGKTPESRAERLKFREKITPLVLQRDNYTCQICLQYGGSLQVDHIQGWAEFPELRFNLDNCRTLCMACHYYVTFKKKLPAGVVWGHNLRRGITS